MIKKIKYALVRKKLIDKVNKLDIVDSGIDEENDCFVKLSNGLIFYGGKIRINLDRKLYNFLSYKVKRNLKKECLQVALDIVIRYVEGGLKYEGPRKQSRYTVKEGDHVSEMGAYQGFCSLKLAQQVGKNGKVVCIEPMADNFRLLTKNKKANHFDQMILVNKGVWDKSKELKFSIRKNDGQSSSIEMEYDNANTYTVKADTLDNIFNEVSSEAKDFMIIQLNGAEINALRGLTSFKPKHLTIAARYDTEGEDAALAIKQILEERGYEVEIDEEDFVFGTLK